MRGYVVFGLFDVILGGEGHVCCCFVCFACLFVCCSCFFCVFFVVVFFVFLGWWFCLKVCFVLFPFLCWVFICAHQTTTKIFL